MITNKEILHLYLDADKFALGINRRFPRPFIDSVWKYQRTLRFYEFIKIWVINCEDIYMDYC